MIAWSNQTSAPQTYPGGSHIEKIEIYIDADYTIYVACTDVHVQAAQLNTRTCLAELERIECSSLNEAKDMAFQKYREYENSYFYESWADRMLRNLRERYPQFYPNNGSSEGS